MYGYWVVLLILLSCSGIHFVAGLNNMTWSSVIQLGTGVSGTAANQLYNPSWVSVSHNTLFVQDFDNRRTLAYFNSSYLTTGAIPRVSLTSPSTSSQGSSTVIGLKASYYKAVVNVWMVVADQFKLFTGPFTNAQQAAITLSLATGGTPINAVMDYSNLTLYTVYKTYHRVVKYNAQNISSDNTTPPRLGIYGQLTMSGTQANQGGSPTASTLSAPVDAVVGCWGDLWVSDTGNNRVLHFPNNSYSADIVIGQSSTTSSNTDMFSSGPYGIAMNSDCSYLWVSDPGSQRVLRFKAPFETGMPPDAQVTGFTSPLGISIDEEDSILWVADYSGNRVLGGTTDIRPAASSSSTISISPSSSNSVTKSLSATSSVVPPSTSSSISTSTSPSVSSTLSISSPPTTSSSISASTPPSTSPSISASTPPSTSPSISTSTPPSASRLESLTSIPSTTTSPTSSPSSSTDKNIPFILSCNLIFFSPFTCVVNGTLDVLEKTLMFNYTTLYINGPIKLADTSAVVLQSYQSIESSDAVHFGGTLIIYINTNSSQAFNISIFQYDSHDGEFSNVQIVNTQEDSDCVVSDADARYEEHSLQVLAMVSGCNGEDSGVDEKLIIGLVIGVGGCVGLVAVLIVMSVIAGIIVMMLSRRSERKMRESISLAD